MTEDATFTDMDVAPTWSLDAIAWAQDTGVVAGMGNNLFDPNANVTREQFAQMMYNYTSYKKLDLTATGDLTQFPDGDQVSNWPKPPSAGPTARASSTATPSLACLILKATPPVLRPPASLQISTRTWQNKIV